MSYETNAESDYSDYESLVHNYPYTPTYTHSGEVYRVSYSLGTPVNPLTDLVMTAEDFRDLCNSVMMSVIFIVPGANVEISEPVDSDDDLTLSGSLDEPGDVYTIGYTSIDNVGLYTGTVDCLVVEPIGDSSDNPLQELTLNIQFYDGAYIATGVDIGSIYVPGGISGLNDPGLSYDPASGVLSGRLTQPGTLNLSSINVTMHVVDAYSDLVFMSDPVLDGAIAYV